MLDEQVKAGIGEDADGDAKKAFRRACQEAFKDINAVLEPAKKVNPVMAHGKLGQAVVDNIAPFVGTDDSGTPVWLDPKAANLKPETVELYNFLAAELEVPPKAAEATTTEGAAAEATTKEAAAEQTEPAEKPTTAAEKLTRSRYGHLLNTMSAAVDDLVWEGTTKEAAAKALAEKFNKDEKATASKFASHVAHLRKKKGVDVVETDGVFKAQVESIA